MAWGCEEVQLYSCIPCCVQPQGDDSKPKTKQPSQEEFETMQTGIIMICVRACRLVTNLPLYSRYISLLKPSEPFTPNAELSK